MTLPDCGLYKTSAELQGIPAGRLVFFHNHDSQGAPQPGLYLPEGWAQNRAHFAKQGVVMSDPSQTDQLEALAAEGLYRVEQPFSCCEKNCRQFEQGLLVQLGYNGEAGPILFVPEWTERGLAFPTTGQPLDATRVAKLALLKVAHTHEDPAALH